MSKWKGFDKNVSDASKTDKNLIMSGFWTILIVGRELQKQESLERPQPYDIVNSGTR